MKNKHSIQQDRLFPIVIVIAALLAIFASACSPQTSEAQDSSPEVSDETMAVEAVSTDPTEQPTDIPPTATFMPTLAPVEAQIDDASRDETASTATVEPAVFGTNTLTTLSNVNVRACPAVTCDIVGSFGGGATINGLERVEGAKYGDSAWWWRVEHPAGAAYVHTAFVK